MSTYLTYSHYYDNLLTENPGMTAAEYKEQLRTYAADTLKSPLSEEEILRMLEKNSLSDPPRPLPRYGAAERAQRKERSEKLRDAMFDFFIASGDRVGIAKVPRQYGNLLEPQASGALTPHNAEVARLFSNNIQARAYELELMQERMNGGMPQDKAAESAREYIAARRGEVVMKQLTERFALLDRLDEMTDENLPADQLAENYKAISEAWEPIFEIDNLLRDVNSGYLKVTDEQKEAMLQMKEQQERFVNAREKLNNIANPVYEFLDINQLNYYDTESFETAYEDRVEHSPDVSIDAVGNFLQDYTSTRTDAYIRINNAYEQTLADYGFSASVADRFSESRQDLAAVPANNADLFAGRPVAVVYGARAVILSRVSLDSDEITVEAPGRLFDQALKQKTRALNRQLEDADPFLLRSSKQFKAMKESMRQVNEMPPLGDDPSPEALRRARRQMQQLLTRSTEYRATKGAHGKNDREQARIDVAENINAYAKMKLEQLDAIEKAQMTLKKYRNMTPVQAQAESQRELHEIEAMKGTGKRPDSRTEKEWLPWELNQTQMGRQFDKENARRKDPAYWLQQEVNSYYNNEEDIPITKLAECADVTMVYVNMLYQGNAEKLEEFRDIIPESLAKLSGSMIAVEMIRSERDRLNTPGIPGPIESVFTGKTDQEIERLAQGLGERALTMQTNKSLAELNADDLKHFADTFDKAHLAAAQTEDFRRQHAPESYRYMQGLTDGYYYGIRNIRGAVPDEAEWAFNGFADKYIRGEAKQYDKLLLDAKGDLSAEMSLEAKSLGTNLLRDCVIYSMVQTERNSLGKNGPGELEKTLQDPQKLQALQASVSASRDFQNMIHTNLFQMDGTRMDTIANLLRQKEPQKIALNILQRAKTAQRQSKEPAKQPVKAVQPPQKQPKQPQK